MKKVLSLLMVVGVCFVASVNAQPLAKEIAFTRSCVDGVPLYDKDSGSVKCGALAASGSGYVLEMAVTRNQVPTCPAGFGFIGNLSSESLAARGITGGSLQYFACVKE